MSNSTGCRPAARGFVTIVRRRAPAADHLVVEHVEALAAIAGTLADGQRQRRAPAARAYRPSSHGRPPSSAAVALQEIGHAADALPLQREQDVAGLQAPGLRAARRARRAAPARLRPDPASSAGRNVVGNRADPHAQLPPRVATRPARPRGRPRRTRAPRTAAPLRCRPPWRGPSRCPNRRTPSSSTAAALSRTSRRRARRRIAGGSPARETLGGAVERRRPPGSNTRPGTARGPGRLAQGAEAAPPTRAQGEAELARFGRVRSLRPPFDVPILPRYAPVAGGSSARSCSRAPGAGDEPCARGRDVRAPPRRRARATAPRAAAASTASGQETLPIVAPVNARGDVAFFATLSRGSRPTRASSSSRGGRVVTVAREGDRVAGRSAASRDSASTRRPR